MLKTTDISITEEEAVDFGTAVQKVHGVDLANYEMRSLLRRLSRVISSMDVDSLPTLQERILLYREEFEKFVDLLTVDLTSMFRDPLMWRYLADKVIPEINQNSNFSIWHAGCASGEEPYTMAIILNELGLSHKARLQATDLNHFNVEKAKRGVYTSRELNNYEINYGQFGGKGKFRDYFESGNESGIINSFLRDQIKFLTNDLTVESITRKYDVILCRNVMIYFNKYLKARVFEYFDRTLKTGGYLIIGLTDSINANPMGHKYDPVTIEYKIYRKMED